MDTIAYDSKQLMLMQEEYVTYLSEVRELYRKYRYEQKGEIYDDQCKRLEELKQKLTHLYNQFPDDVKAMYTPITAWWVN